MDFGLSSALGRDSESLDGSLCCIHQANGLDPSRKWCYTKVYVSSCICICPSISNPARSCYSFILPFPKYSFILTYSDSNAVCSKKVSWGNGMLDLLICKFPASVHFHYWQLCCRRIFLANAGQFFHEF